MANRSEIWSKAAREALLRLAADTRGQAVAARMVSRELATEREQLLAELEAGLREQGRLLADVNGARDRLHAAVRAYACLLRRQDTPPEKMLVEVKECVRHAPAPRGARGQELMAQVVAWSIEGYYEQASA